MIRINAARLIAAVVETGWNETEFCALSGIAHQTFAKMRQGQMVRFPAISKVCKFLKLAPGEIIEEVSDHEDRETAGFEELVSETGRLPHQPKNKSQGNGLAITRGASR